MRSNEKAFSFSVKHYSRDLVDERLTRDINEAIRALHKMVAWFNRMHDVDISPKQGENILENIPMTRRVRDKILSLWYHPNAIMGPNSTDRNLGNMLNAATQLLTHEQERVNVIHSNRLTARVFDALKECAYSPVKLQEYSKPRAVAGRVEAMAQKANPQLEGGLPSLPSQFQL